MLFDEICDTLARELPPDWQVIIQVEKDSGTVELWYDGECHEEATEGYGSMYEAVRAALGYARENDRARR